ncbi:AAA domain-containing protein [Aspergillus transmontanensis]|uniref:AAA domain-containing protein n=1 Tax=Aspergillus transmontanensis TaxID=1034304 RepID=A0A5N6VQ32_9EURO|nr:AAA domain-containing protein [Aspergillus transmontanensis]
MITAPTHYAADAICQGIQKWETLSGINLHPLRVYRPISESRAFRNHGKSGIDPEVESQHGDELSGDEDGDDYGGDSGEYDDAKNIPSSNAVVAQDDKAQAIHPTPSDENTEAAAIEPSNNNAAVAQGDNVETAPDALGPLQDQIMIGECLKMTHEAYHRRYYSRTDISLEAKVFEMASDDSQTLMAIRPSSEQAVTIKGDWFAQIENGNLIPEGDEVDVLALLRDYAEKIKESEYRKLEDSDKKTALWAFKTACKAVIRQTRLLISTNNNTGDGIIASNFGHDATGIIIIRDEDFKELEANSWIPVSKLAAAEKIKGVVSCGDAHQLVPTVMSRYGQPCNEFSAQLALSLPARLLHMNHPSVKLTEQFRYRDVFVPWLNHRTYNGELRSHSSVKQIKVNSNFLNAIKEILDFKHPATEVDLGYLVVSVEGSSCEVEEPSKSRFNDPHRRFCVELLKANFAHGGYAGKDITIVTPYMAQVVRIRQSIFKMVQHGLLPIDQMPNVATADSMQGKESKVIIYDWVISAADRGSDLGFTSDDNRSNVALSRMTEVMIVLVPGDVGTGGLSEPKAQKYNELGDNVYRRVPYPCAFVKWAQSNKIFMTYKKPTDIPVPIDETPATETGTGEWSSTPASTEAPAIEGATIDESPATETGTGEWSSTPAIDGAAIENVIGE